MNIICVAPVIGQRQPKGALHEIKHGKKVTHSHRNKKTELNVKVNERNNQIKLWLIKTERQSDGQKAVEKQSEGKSEIHSDKYYYSCGW